MRDNNAGDTFRLRARRRHPSTAAASPPLEWCAFECRNQYLIVNVHPFLFKLLKASNSHPPYTNFQVLCRHAHTPNTLAHYWQLITKVNIFSNMRFVVAPSGVHIFRVYCAILMNLLNSFYGNETISDQEAAVLIELFWSSCYVLPAVLECASATSRSQSAASRGKNKPNEDVLAIWLPSEQNLSILQRKSAWRA